MQKGQSGYILITSVIILSLLLLTIVTVLSLINYFGEFNILENQYKERSENLAKSCVFYAIGKLVGSANYPGNECVYVGSSHCAVVSVAAIGAENIIEAQGVYNNSYSNLRVTIDSGFKITNWEEVNKLISSACP